MSIPEAASSVAELWRFVEPPKPGREPPPVRVDLPNGVSVTSDWVDCPDKRRFRMNVIVGSAGTGFVENERVGRRLALGDDIGLTSRR